MLTKKQAQIFFFGGTAVTFFAFLVLTTNSMINDVPAQTHPENLSEKVIRGKQLWEDNNCMGCHTILGEGGYYAPELTRVYDRRGGGFIKAVLMSPEPWAPRGRKMVAYEMSEKDAEDMVAFFEWINELDLNGFPPEPHLKNK